MRQAAKCLMVGVIALMGAHVATCQADETAVSAADDAKEIYGAFLTQWKGKHDVLTNVANTVARPTTEDIAKYNACAGSASRQNVHWTTSTTDADIKNALVSLSRINLVDPEHWQAADPSTLIAEGQSVDTAVETGMANGLMTLSAISFDEMHHTAVFSFSFICGSLCGHGGIVMFKKTPKGWVQSRQLCGSWMS